jgi:hypothetical protein
LINDIDEMVKKLCDTVHSRLAGTKQDTNVITSLVSVK